VDGLPHRTGMGWPMVELCFILIGAAGYQQKMR
jgi:hypothetical protein